MSQILQISPLGTQNTVITKGSYVWRVCEGPQWSQSPRRLGNLTRSSLVTFSLRRPHRQSPAIVRGTNQYKLVTSNDEQGRARRTKGGAPCLLGHINVAFKRHVSPHVFAIAKHPFTCVCFSKHSLTCLPQENLSITGVSTETRHFHFTLVSWKVSGWAHQVPSFWQSGFCVELEFFPWGLLFSGCVLSADPHLSIMWSQLVSSQMQNFHLFPIYLASSPLDKHLKQVTSILFSPWIVWKIKFSS